MRKNLFNCFNVLLTVHLDNLCNEDQLYALFILNLFLQSTSTFFGRICPSAGGTHYIYTPISVVVIPYRLFGTTYRSPLQGSNPENGTDKLSRNVGDKLQLLAA
jgi:hypothetical protein